VGVRHVGTWVAVCTPEQDFIKWGRHGDTIYPYPPDDVEALEMARHVARSDVHENDRIYVLRVFDNGQMLTLEFDPLEDGLVRQRLRRAAQGKH
jgi:hypothetical protein